MKTSIEKDKESRIKKLQDKIIEDKAMFDEKKQDQKTAYNKVKDFTMSDNKAKIIIEKLGTIKSELKTISKRIIKNESELAELR